MVVATRTIRIPTFLELRSGALASCGTTISAALDTANVVVVTGRLVSAGIADDAVASLEQTGAQVTVCTVEDGSQKAAEGLARALADAPPDVVVAVGGGRVIDVAKLAAHVTERPFVAVPTTLSHDGMASPVASLANEEGRRESIGATVPAGVIIDLDVVRTVPDGLARAGIGDLVSNLTAIADWRAAADAGLEPFDDLAGSIALQSATPVLDIAWPLEPSGIELLARGLVMSGLAMEIAGSSRPCSGAEHLISHALDELLGPAARSHGEQVALGTLIAARLGNHDVDAFQRLFVRIGLPTTVVGWGVPLDVLVAAVQRAPSTRPGRRTVLDRIDLSTESIEAVVHDALEIAVR